MEIIRRNTDYALRLMVNLAGRNNGSPVSSRVLSSEMDVSYQLACKLLQKLNGAGLVQSRMGPQGGFSLARQAREITLREIVETVQGPVNVNKCLMENEACRFKPGCPVGLKLVSLQEQIDGFFGETTLQDILDGSKSGKARKSGKVKK